MFDVRVCYTFIAQSHIDIIVHTHIIHIHIYMYIYTYMCTDVYVYIYIQLTYAFNYSYIIYIYNTHGIVLAITPITIGVINYPYSNYQPTYTLICIYIYAQQIILK